MKESEYHLFTSLQVSEERLQTLINASPDIICFKDAGGRWVQANESILELYGLKGVDYTGKTEYELAEFTAPIYRDAFKNCQGSDDLAWAAGGTSRTIENIPDISGKMHVFDVVKVPLFYEDGNRKGIIVFGRDITEIKQAESALRESEAKYRQIADYTSDVIWMMNPKMEYTYISPSIFKQRGFTCEEFLRLKPEELYTPDSLQKVFTVFSEGIRLAAEGKMTPDYVTTVEVKHLCKDGSARDSEVLISPVFDSDNKLIGAHGVSRDISDRKLAMEQIRILSEFQSQLLKINDLNDLHELVVHTVHGLIGEGIVFTTNIDHTTGSGKVISFKGLDVPRNSLTKILGLDPFEMEFYLKDITGEELKLYRSGNFEEMPGGLFSITTHRFSKTIIKAIENILRIRKVYAVGFVYHDHHLGVLVILARHELASFGETIGMIIHQASISMNRIKAEASLKEAEERFRLAFQTSPDSININHLKTGQYLEVNEGFCTLTGYTKEEVLGKTSREIDIWQDWSERTRMVEMLLRDGKVTNFETVFRFKNGTMHTGLFSASIIHLNGVPHVISITRDIEELKCAEREIVHAKEAAEEASRLKTAFLNNISHEVRTPMNAIMGFTELLQNEEITAPERERFFGIINSNSVQLLSIIDDVLEISRMDSGWLSFNSSVFSLHELMEDIYLSMNEMVNKKGLSFRFTPDEKKGSEYIAADREKIRQVLTGFISNAIKFTHSGSISLGCCRKGKELEFYVRDTGIGIDECEHEKIFERFYQVSRDTMKDIHGTGLGLSIARGLAEMMNGSVRVESAPGKGATFLLSIPYQESAVPFTDGEQSRPFSMESMTLIVAEDEDYNYELIHVLLLKKTKKIIRAKNGSEVIEILKKQKPDLILMDLKMPVMSGYEATRAVKNIYPELPVIALTAYTQPEEERHAMEAGCNAFISKPISKKELMETIRRFIRN
jgi:PAS domain S-box-containing protein